MKRVKLIEHVTNKLIEIEHQDHCERVGRYSERLAEICGLDTEESKLVGLLGYFHDVGKIEVPIGILNKCGKITFEERIIINSHSSKGEEIIREMDIFKDHAHIIRHHHENWDGSGYPDKLKGENIPLYSRIISIADVYDALTSKRPYRDKEFTEIEALGILHKESGTKFDPYLVIKFMNNITRILQEPLKKKIV